MKNKVGVVGKVVSNGGFYTPKYFVAKLKEDSDVLMSTARKSLEDCRKAVEAHYIDRCEDIVIVLIEIKNASEEVYDVWKNRSALY